MKQKLPPRQQDVLNAIVELTDEQGYPPTLAELARALGLKNRMTVHQHVAALKRKGLVNWESGLNRSLRVLDEGLEYVTVEGTGQSGSYFAGAAGAGQGGSSQAGRVNKSDQSQGSGRALPLAGRIAAGSPIDAIETPEYLSVESDYAQSGCFALEVRGDSMIEDGIYDGDYVIVKPQPSPGNGDIVVALLGDGTATLKRFFKENGGYRLQPGNSRLEPIFLSGREPPEIQGVVVGLFRRMS